ncbi:hypothetical protein CKM354_000715000 [Cercospora kikuchii]|uniref:Uncharacterized protein n=1 Tax=Cercospora kikuchii TaxID=84275 RepID=A0A9P3CKM7_9PEZI|nr:uncharacterized protein CKM354_000715000 [Cercospora kikuchii]GIZ43941.1 hypothetical protein CKM354_000715000 [Cercospora kikuchii]
MEAKSKGRAFDRGFPEAEKLLAEDQWASSQHCTPGQKSQAHGRMFYVSFSLLNITLGLVLGYFCVRYSRLSVTSWGVNPNTPVPQDIFTMRKNVAFSPDRRYMGPGAEVNSHWNTLTASSDSVYISEPERYSLHDAGIRAPMFIFDEPPASAASLDNVNNFYVLNTLHQLHCTNVIRRRYNMLVYDPDVSPLAKNPEDEDWIEHVEHCIEYLRYSITCADYMVLESDSPPGSPPEFYEGGLAWGVVHSCINWERLMQWQRNQLEAYNRTWNTTA